jgi:acetolactate synthase-1/2/3 large subunit
VYLPPTVPDYVGLAEAYGAVGLRAESPDEVENVVDKAMSITDRPCVIDFRVDTNEMCFPMVPAGASNDEIILGPEMGASKQTAVPAVGSDYAFGGMGA